MIVVWKEQQLKIIIILYQTRQVKESDPWHAWGMSKQQHFPCRRSVASYFLLHVRCFIYIFVKDDSLGLLPTWKFFCSFFSFFSLFLSFFLSYLIFFSYFSKGMCLWYHVKAEYRSLRTILGLGGAELSWQAKKKKKKKKGPRLPPGVLWGCWAELTSKKKKKNKKKGPRLKPPEFFTPSTPVSQGPGGIIDFLLLFNSFHCFY